jgi:hypothetical protein
VIAVAETAPLRVQLIAKTEFFAPPDVLWSTDADGGEALVERARRRRASADRRSPAARSPHRRARGD